LFCNFFLPFLLVSGVQVRENAFFQSNWVGSAALGRTTAANNGLSGTSNAKKGGSEEKPLSTPRDAGSDSSSRSGSKSESKSKSRPSAVNELLSVRGVAGLAVVGELKYLQI
jgi:hypothetical protein